MIAPSELLEALQGPGTKDLTYIVGLEKSAVAFVENQTGRYFGPAAEVTEYVIGGGTPSLWLAEAPASLPETVTERAYPGSDGTTISAADANGYVLRGTMRLVRKGGAVWARGYEYEATYTRGYAAGEEPADIRKLVKDLVGYWYEERMPVGAGETTTEALPMHARAVLERWRRRPWA